MAMVKAMAIITIRRILRVVTPYLTIFIKGSNFCEVSKQHYHASRVIMLSNYSSAEMLAD